jgi:hypothetical protein
MATHGTNDAHAHGGGGHGHGAHHGTDTGAAFTGLIVGAIFVGSILFGVVKWTNARYAGHEGAKAHATETR